MRGCKLKKTLNHTKNERLKRNSDCSDSVPRHRLLLPFQIQKYQKSHHLAWYPAASPDQPPPLWPAPVSYSPMQMSWIFSGT